MSFNPLKERGIPLERQLRNWSELNTPPYDPNAVHPYTRCRAIFMNGIEVEAIINSHQFARHTADVGVKQKLALVRRIEQQQQKAVNWLIPGNETTIERTIGYEQVAVDLTNWLARQQEYRFATEGEHPVDSLREEGDHDSYPYHQVVSRELEEV